MNRIGEKTMPKPRALKKADYIRLLEEARAECAKLQGERDGQIEIGTQWKDRAEKLEKLRDSDRATAKREKQDLQYLIHTLELQLERARGYIDRIKDVSVEGRDHIVQPEIRQPILPNGPDRPVPPEPMNDRERNHFMQRAFQSRRNGDTEEFPVPPQPWWAR